MMELDYKEYLNKVHGGWIGKCIGGAVGALQENNKNLMNYTIDNVFPEVIPPNDDLDLQVLWLQEVLGKKGTNFSSNDLADAFVKYNRCLANEYGVAIKNIELGIEPPLSGVFNNSYFKNSMGCPIRSEIWGFICPGNPEVAVSYAQKDGSIDHGMESIIGEQFYAAIEACAFFDMDIKRLIKRGLEYVPVNTELSFCINFVTQQYLKGTDWVETRHEMVKRFGSADASYSTINIGITIMALLYGEGDFTRTMLIAVNSGFDTDCTAATAGAILGEIIGAESIPIFWLDKIGKEVVIGTVDIERSSNLIVDLAKETCSAGLSLIRDGIISTRIINIPQDIKPLLPLLTSTNMVEIQVEYKNRPTIGYGEKSSVIITLKNDLKEEQIGRLLVTSSKGIHCSHDDLNVCIPSGSEVRIPLEFEFEKDIPIILMHNIISAVFEKNGEKITEKFFGLAGAARMKLIGPFYDNYDTTKYKSDPYNNKMPRIGELDYYAMFNGFVNIDRPYLDESFTNIDELSTEYVNFHEDKLEIDEKVGYKGPCCVYIIHDFECTDDIDDAELLIGNNAPYRVWLNGQVVSESKGHPMWTIFNDFGMTMLKAGTNRLIIKVIRTSGRFEFSCLFRSLKYNHHHYLINLGSVNK